MEITAVRLSTMVSLLNLAILLPEMMVNKVLLDHLSILLLMFLVKFLSKFLVKYPLPLPLVPISPHNHLSLLFMLQCTSIHLQPLLQFDLHLLLVRLLLLLLLQPLQLLLIQLRLLALNSEEAQESSGQGFIF